MNRIRDLSRGRSRLIFCPQVWLAVTLELFYRFFSAESTLGCGWRLRGFFKGVRVEKEKRLWKSTTAINGIYARYVISLGNIDVFIYDLHILPTIPETGIPASASITSATKYRYLILA